MGRGALIAAARLALEALELAYAGADAITVHGKAIDALRAALAEPEPFQPDWDRAEALQESLREHMDEVRQLREQNTALDAKLAELVAAAAAVAEPVALETVYETIIHWDEGGGKRSRRELARRIAALYAASLQPEAAAVAEPVAWCSLTPAGAIGYFDGKPMVMPGKLGNEHHTTPLYAAPPQREPYDQTALGLCNACGWKAVGPDGCLNCAPPREPLTDEQIIGLARDTRMSLLADYGKGYVSIITNEVRDFARAIERAHGIAPASAPTGWVCPACGTDRLKAACPKGYSAALTGQCPMVGTAQASAPKDAG